MSGIAGVQNQKNSALVGRMLETVAHRGPDGRELLEIEAGTVGGVSFRIGPRSLPAVVTAGGITVLLDGEIYNFPELQQLLGEECSSEAELVLKLYRKMGRAFAGAINGPFALAICEGSRILLARDSLGQAPLYWGHGSRGLCFASEMKALIVATDDIHALEPGHWLDGESDPQRYEIQLPGLKLPADPGEVAVGLRALLEKAVERRVREEGLVGSWLSGGLDSASLAALASKMTRNLCTFSAGVSGASDLKFARQTAGFIGSRHFEINYTVDEMLQALPRVIYHLESFDALLVRSSISNYMVAGLASKHVRAALSGEGGDELFAGYNFFKQLGENEIPGALAEAQAALAKTALMRVDRMAAAHGTRGRACLLDPEVVAYANAIPAALKIFGKEKIEKWILRQALQGDLPEEVRMRPKEKFWSGSGVGDSLAAVALSRISDEEFAREREIAPGFNLPSREDLFYFRIFKRFFPAAKAVTTMRMTVQRDWH